MTDNGGVRPLDEINDVEELKERARLAERAASQYAEKLEQMQRRIEQLESPHKEQLLKEVRKLLDEMARMRATPGHKSEKRGPAQQSQSKERQPQTGHGRREQPQLPVVEVVHKLDEADCTCPECGKPLKEWEGQFEESEDIHVVVRGYTRRKHKRQKYHCSCGHIETALAPVKLQAKGRYSLEFAVEVAVDKYENHLPLERQVTMMAREGLVVDSQTLWDQLVAMYHILSPVLGRMRAYLREQRVLGMDETRWPVLGKESKNWTMWCVRAPNAVLYDIRMSRGADEAKAILEGFSGTLVVDGYAVYPVVAQAFPSLRLAFCWAHVRRHFLKAESANRPEVEEILEKIRRLFMVEREVKLLGSAERVALRKEKSQPIVDEIHHWLLNTPALPESSLRKAMEYTAARWTGLTRFLEDGDIPLSNNDTEGSIRGPVLGRNAHHGSKSAFGTKVSALFYSLFESAALARKDGRGYLNGALRDGLAGRPIPLPHEFDDTGPPWDSLRTHRAAPEQRTRTRPGYVAFPAGVTAR